ncbi:MAG TPA: lipoate--protein ligase family protein [Sulfurospirillum arcachonense]|nr:lipoate--protein ligase family protein [Sulfurospirillum arcachonense]
MAITNWKFIDTHELCARENMEFDKSLLELGEPTFRLYTWKENSFTLGRSQKKENVEKFGNDWARRETGGGLLLHGCDISYSITIPTKLLGNKNVKESYEYLCSFLLHFYKKLGLHVEYAKDINLELNKSFFCQEGFEPYDIICDGKKIGGNAQRRTKTTILQHGSIPLKIDTREHAGYSLEEFGVNLSPKKIKDLLRQSFVELF